MTAAETVFEKAIAGERLTAADRAALHATTDVIGLGMAADEVRRRRHGNRMTFVRVAELQLTGLPPGPIAWPPSAGELRLRGDLTDVPRVLESVRRVVEAAGGLVPVTGFSLADIEAVAAGSASKASDLLQALGEARLSMIAEAPLDELRSPEVLLAAVERVGLGIARVTLERAPAEHRLALLERAATILPLHPWVTAFAPLPRRTSGGQPATGFEDVRLVALARLVVDVPRIQVDWALYGPKLAQVALTFGADDVDSVSPVDETTEGRWRSPLEEIRRNIIAASGHPIERNGRFEPRG
jgi:aminodeoxyfutalosine synthase